MTLLVVVRRVTFVCVVMLTLAGSAHAGAVSCKVAAEHLATLIKSNWPSSGENIAVETSDMVGSFLKKQTSGVVAGKMRFELKQYSRQAFVEQASHLHPPFTPSDELLKALDDVQEVLVVSELPGSTLFAANSIGGTAHCNATVFFSVNDGHARLVAQPKNWEDDAGGSCGLTRSFASIDGLSVVIDDNLDSGPSLASSLTLTPRDDGKWLKPCQTDFTFAPNFDSTKTLNDWAHLDDWENKDCGNGGCERFQHAAFDLVRLTQQNPSGVEAHLLAALTGPQRKEYQRLKRVADRPDPDVSQPGNDETPKPKTAAALTDTDPLSLPMVVVDRVYLATLGHFTIGWRVFSDWKVTVEAGEGDKVKEIARFVVGMTQGPIIGVTVK